MPQEEAVSEEAGPPDSPQPGPSAAAAGPARKRKRTGGEKAGPPKKRSNLQSDRDRPQYRCPVAECTYSGANNKLWRHLGQRLAGHNLGKEEAKEKVAAAGGIEKLLIERETADDGEE